VLEVSRSASQDEVKKAYRKKALQYHPDRNPGDKESEAKFKEATEAYNILSNPETRQTYDQFGHDAFDRNGSAAGFSGDFSGFEDLFGDLFGAFFGGAAGGGRKVRSGRDLRYDLEVDFVEAALGAEKEINLQKRVVCFSCSGSGAAKGSSKKECRECRGAGQVKIQQGFFTLSRSCTACSGVGEIIEKPCMDCSGAGNQVKNSKISVKIPAGIDEGQRLKLRGEGEPGQAGAPSGDLYVQIAIKPHKFFKRDEADLICEYPVSYSTAVIGGEIDVPTLEGKASLKIPSGTEPGKVLKMKGKGVPILGSNRRGDLNVIVTISVPKKISDERRKLLEELKQLDAKEIEEKGFFDKVKEFFA
jgi:molecular chaperone DnaJ